MVKPVLALVSGSVLVGVFQAPITISFGGVQLLADLGENLYCCVDPVLDVDAVSVFYLSQLLDVFGFFEGWEKLWSKVDVFDDVSGLLFDLGIMNDACDFSLFLEVDWLDTDNILIDLLRHLLKFSLHRNRYICLNKCSQHTDVIVGWSLILMRMLLVIEKYFTLKVDDLHVILVKFHGGLLLVLVQDSHGFFHQELVLVLDHKAGVKVLFL